MVTVSFKEPLEIVMLPSRFSISSLEATWNDSVEVFKARDPLAVIQSFAFSSMVYSKSTLAFTSIFTSPPSASTSNLPEVTVKASFCFCETVIVFCVLPALMTTDAERSSGVSLAVVRMVILASPALPPVGETEHQPSARLLITSAVQAAEVLNVTTWLPPSTVKSEADSSKVMDGWEGVGSGSGSVPSSPPPEQATIHTMSPNSSHP